VAAGALVTVGFLWFAPRPQPAAGTLLVVTSGRSAGTVAATRLMIHGGGGWIAVGNVSGSVPAAPVEQDALQAQVGPGLYDAIRFGDAMNPYAF